MESAAPMFSSTRENTNYARLCRLLVDVGSQVLREVFDKIRPVGGLDTVLGSTSVSATLQSLRHKNILNPLQWRNLYPAIKSSVSSKNFDITLLMVLLRSICGLTPPATGWNDLPPPTDLTCGADIVRINYYRKTVYAHVTQASFADEAFDNHWSHIRDTLVRLGGPTYEAAIDDLKYEYLNPDMEERYKELLKQWKMVEDNIKDKLNGVEAKVDELQASVNKMERQLRPTFEMINGKPKSELPEKEPNIYGRTKEIESIVQVLSVDSGENVAGVLVTGPAGVGKSTVAVHAGHWIKNEFEAIVKYCSLRGTYKAGEILDEDVLREIFNVCVPGHQQGSEFPRYVLLNWCRQLENEMILIVDNVDHAIEVRRSKYDLFNLLSDMRMCSDWKLKFLLTSSRDIEAVETDSNIQLRKIYLDALDVEESIKVLKNGAQLTSNNDPKTEFKLRKIAELCENNPLALRLAGPLLAEESVYTFEELQQNLEQNPVQTLGIMPMMKIAFEQLDQNLQRALVCLSVFPRSFKKDAAETVLGDNCAEALTNLKKRCLIQKQGDRYLIHLLIRSYTKDIGKQREEFGQILADGKQYYLRHFLSLLLKNAQNYWGKDTCKESLKLFNEERVNLEFTLKEVAGGQKNVQNSKELEGVVNACGQVAPYIDGCVPFKLSVDFGYGVLQFSQSQENVAKQVEILCFLYDAARRHGGDMEQSKGLIDEAFKQYKNNPQLFEQNSLSEALFLSQYGRYLSQDLDRRDEAQPFLQKALTIVSKETVEHPSTFGIGRVLGQMGHNARLGKRDNDNLPKEALNYFQRALNFHQCHYGEHVVTALAHKDLAGIYMSVDDFAKAEENYDAAVRMFECLGMMKKKEVIPTFKNFARCCEKSGKIDEARRKFEMAIEVADTTIEGNHKWKVEINTNLAFILYKNYPNEVGKAEELSKDVFHMAKELKMVKWHQSEKLKTFYKTK